MINITSSRRNPNAVRIGFTVSLAAAPPDRSRYNREFLQRESPGPISSFNVIARVRGQVLRHQWGQEQGSKKKDAGVEGRRGRIGAQGHWGR